MICNIDGRHLCIVAAHFSHRATKRQAQWQRASDILSTLSYEHKVILAHHNSLIVPSRDSSPVFDDKTNAIVEATDVEIKVLRKFQLQDAYIHVHEQGQRQDTPPPPASPLALL